MSAVLTELGNNYYQSGFDEFGNYVISSSLYEYDRVLLRDQFIADWNSFIGTTWTELAATAFFNSAKIGVTSPTNLAGSNIYNFFNDPVTGAKWGWLLTFIENNDGTTHPSRQVVAIKGDGTNGTFALYDADQLSYGIANFFNKAHDIGGFTGIDFTTPGGLAKYNNIPTYNNKIFVDGESFNGTYTGESITIPDVPAKDYYTTDGYKNGDTVVNPGLYLVEGNVKLVPQYIPIAYTIKYFDGATELTTLSPKTYTVEAGVTLANYIKEGFVFDGWYDNAELSETAITAITKGDTGNKVYYAKTTESAFVEVAVTYDLNDGQLNSTDLYTLRTTDVKIIATRYSTAGDTGGFDITVGTSRGGLYWQVIGLKPTGVTGIYEVVGKGAGYTNAEATLYVSYHDSCTSSYKAALVAQYKTTATVGSLVVIEWLPAGVMAVTSVDMYFIAASQATANVVINMQESDAMLAPVRTGYTFNGWCELADCSDTPITTYPGYTSSSGVTEKTYYAKWTSD